MSFVVSPVSRLYRFALLSAFLLMLAGALAAPAGATPQITVLDSTDSPYSALVEGTDGNFYGTTQTGGANSTGRIFKMTPNGTLTTIYTFSALSSSNPATNSDGAHPYAALVLGPDGNFYGAAYNGGAGGGGTIFKITPGGTFTTLASCFIATTGSYPEGTLIVGSDGNFYGTTSIGGSGGRGTVFVITPSGVLTVLHAFSSLPASAPYTNSDGANPFGGLMQGTDGNFYGTTSIGGTGGEGTIFSMTASGTLTTLYSFSALPGGTGSANSDGAQPQDALVQGPDGNVYGTTLYGGANSWGTVFKITPSGSYSVLHTFSALSNGTGGTNSDGAQSHVPLVLGPDGNFYGTTQDGGTQYGGTVFKITPGGTLTTLIDFSSTTGASSYFPVVFGSDGNLYGTTYFGGTANGGTIYKITAQSQVLYNFSAVSANGTNGDGASPYASPTQGSDGNFYGTTSAGGTFADGALYRITPSGVFTSLFDFNGTTGSDPFSGLILGTDGNFYGTTNAGGASFTQSYPGYGTAFKLTPTGSVTTLASLTYATGYNALAPLVQGPDGNFYGTTYQGGAYNEGSVFQVTPGGVLTTLAYFNNANGAYPESGLAVGPDGAFYGTTLFGGASGDGTVFKVTSGGTLTTLLSFNGTDGGDPSASLALGPDGNFYGTTSNGGANSYGTVFKITPGGTLTTLFSFDITHGAAPVASLTPGANGSFYGTTLDGGASSKGTVFQVTPAGGLTTVLSFDGVNGANPESSPSLGADGGLYGTTQFGGLNNTGVVYRLIAPLQGAISSVSVNESTPVTFSLAFSDPVGFGVDSVAFPTAPAHGTVSLVPGSITETGTTGTVSVTYTPLSGYHGPDSFTYTVTGFTGTSAPQAVTVTVNQVPATVTVSPATVTLSPGGTQLFTAVVKDAAGTVFSPAQLTWSVSGGGTIDANGNFTAGTAAGTGIVTAAATANGGTRTGTATVTISGTPILTSLSPSSVTTGTSNTIVYITGTNFTSNSVANWNGSARPTGYEGPTLIYAVVLVTDLTQVSTDSITVTNPGMLTSNALTFTVVNPVATIVGLSPTSAIVGGPAFTLTVSGEDYAGKTFITGAVVNWNGVALPTTFVSATQLTAVIPAADIATAGTVSITVTNPGTAPSSPSSFTVYPPGPALTSISPTLILTGSPDTALTATGTGFVSGATVNFNGTALSTVYVSPTTVTATVPASDLTYAGSASMTVTNPGTAPSNALTLSVVSPTPSLTALSPFSATAGGPTFTLTVTGATFFSGAVINWNGAALPTTFVSATQLTALVPASDIATAGTASVTVTNFGTDVSSALTLSILNPTAVITAMSPASAIVGSPAFTLTVTGTNFITGAAIYWNGVALTTTFISMTQLTAVVPASDLTQAQSVTVSVRNPGTGDSNYLFFGVDNPAPTLTSLSPASVTAGAAAFTLTITGTGFLSGASVSLNGSPVSTVFVSSTQLTVAVTAAQVAAPGTISVTVANPQSMASNALTLTVTTLAPTVTSFTPTSGPIGTVVTVTGAHLNGVTAVRFHNTNATVFSANGAGTVLTVTVPSGAGTGTFTVTTPGGSVKTTGTFTVILPPTVTSFTPTHGPVGTVVTVTGTHLNGVTAVRFHNANATIFSANGAGTQLTVTVPKGAGTGTFTVTTPGGSVKTTGTFTVN